MIVFISEQKMLLHPQIRCTKDIKELTDYLDNLEEKTVVHDTETTGLDPHSCTLLLNQLGDDKMQFVVDQRHPDINKIIPYLESTEYLKIYANAKFDYKQIWHHMKTHIWNLYDVLLAERCIYNGIMTAATEAMYKNEHGFGRFSLAGLSMHYLMESLDKGIRASFINHSGDFSAEQILYAASDIGIPYRIYKKQIKVVEQYKLKELVQLENDVTPAFAEMEYNGIGIDVEQWNILYKENVKSLKNIEIQLDNIITSDSVSEDIRKKYTIGKQLGLFEGTDKRDCKIKWSSPKQKVELLENLGFDTWIIDDKDKQEKQSSDIKVLKKYKDDHPLIPILIDYGETKKSIDAYGDKFLRHINPVTGRIHTEYFQIKNTGRVASSKPNMQNIPPKKIFNNIGFRDCFVPKDGNSFNTADYSNMELRIIADKSDEDVLLDAFKRGEDVHSTMAMMIQKIGFGRDIKVSKTENSEYRTESKTITFALAFGASEFKVSEQLGITMELASDLINAYFKAMPKLKQFFNSLKLAGTTHGFIRTFKPYNRLRWFPEFKEYKTLLSIPNKDKGQFRRMMILKGGIERESSNTPIQGSAADIVKKALVMIHKRFIEINKKYNSDDPQNHSRVKLLLQVHDEILSESPDELSEIIKEDVKFLMEMAGTDVVNKIKMECEPNTGKHWDH